MVERYHLVLAVGAAAFGLLVALVDRLGPSSLSRRSIGIVVASTVALSWDGQLGAIGGIAILGSVAVLVFPDEIPPEHPLGRRVVPMAWVSLVGVWAGVPDTEAPVVALCCLGPLACSRFVQRRGVGLVGWVSLSVLVLATAWIGSAGWGAARATGCAVGAVLVAPIVLGLRPRPLTGRPATVVVGIHVVFALAMPRLVMRMAPVPAALVACGSLAVLGGVVALAARPTLDVGSPPSG